MLHRLPHPRPTHRRLRINTTNRTKHLRTTNPRLLNPTVLTRIPPRRRRRLRASLPTNNRAIRANRLPMTPTKGLRSLASNSTASPHMANHTRTTRAQLADSTEASRADNSEHLEDLVAAKLAMVLNSSSRPTVNPHNKAVVTTSSMPVATKLTKEVNSIRAAITKASVMRPWVSPSAC
jgi:hypothetical protein